MKEQEKQLFKELCKFKGKFTDTSLVELATPSVLGHLFYNRMQGIAYGTLKKNGLLGKVNREFKNALQTSYEQNIQRNYSFNKCVRLLSGVLSNCDRKFAMLKGAYLCHYYPDGYRTSNDVDLLVSPNDVSIIGNLLVSEGFVQGNIKNGEFVPATRKEIIESKMLRGETVPYIKEVNLPFMRYFEVDINYSLDYKNGNIDILSEMLSKASMKNVNGHSIMMLDDSDFFIHLCAHLYKEATSLPWIEMHRDMTLYKYCDIYMLLSDMSYKQLNNIFERAKALNLEKICAYAILETNDLFDIGNSTASKIAKSILETDPDFRLRVISPKDRKMFIYRTNSATDRFFMDSRKRDLMEVYHYEKT